MATSPYLITTSGNISYKTNGVWSTFVAPASTDNVTIANSSANFTQGYLNTFTLTSMEVPMTFQGTMGLENQTVQGPSGATRSTTTLTVTCAAHGYANGDVVTFGGADQSNYNVISTIANVTTNTFDMTVTNASATPATTSTAFTVQRSAYLSQPCTTLNFGTAGNNSSSVANGTGRFRMDMGTVATTINVFQTASNSTDNTQEPAMFLGSSTSNILNMRGGQVGIATGYATETSTLSQVNMTGGKLNLGPGVLWNTVIQSGGVLNLNCGGSSGASITQTFGARCKLSGAGTIGTISSSGFIQLDFRATSGASLTNLNINNGGVVDLSNNPLAITITNLTVSGNTTIIRNRANTSQVVITNPIVFAADSTLTYR